MTLETFFSKFDLFADAPNAVAKMRELVLELAVRGRLFPSKNADSSAPSAPFPIPHDWQWIALNKAADCRAASKVDSASLKDSDWVLDLEDIDGGAGLVITTTTFAERRSLSTKAAFQPGDVLYGKLRPYLNKVVIADRPGFCTTEVIPLRPRQFVAAGYLRLFLRSPHFLRYAAAKNYGMKMPRLGTTDLESAEIPLPPLAEQKRIVAKVDELMALCDRLEAQQQEREQKKATLARASLARFAAAPTPANLDMLFYPPPCPRASVRKSGEVSHRGTKAQSTSSFLVTPADLRKSILTLAVQGKLVPQDPNDESAEELLARIESTKNHLIQQRRIKRVTVEPNPSGDACDPLPIGWLWTRLGNTFDVRDGTHATPKYTTEGYPLITSKNIYSGNLLFDGANLISEEDHRQISERSRVDRGDILFAMIGSIGNPVIVDTDREFSIKNVALFKYYDVNDVAPGFLLLYLKLVAEEMRANAAGAVQSFVSLGFLRNYLFPLPPLAEQRRIVAKVDELMALVDELETQLASARAAAANLLTALVAELTAGKESHAAA